MFNIYFLACILVIEFLFLNIFDGKNYCRRQFVFCSSTAGDQSCMHYCVCETSWKQASMLGWDSYVSSEPLKGLHSITTLLRRGSIRKFSSKAAAATSSHSGSKDRAGSQLAYCTAWGSEHTASHPAAWGRQTQTVCCKIFLVSCL